MYSDDQIDRCATLGGEFGKKLDVSFSNVSAAVSKIQKRKKREVPDVQRFLEEYQEDQLWDYIPGRAHNGFANIKLHFGLTNGQKFAQTIDKYSTNLSVWQKFKD